MKSILGITIFIMLGLLTAVIIAFPHLFASGNLPTDYEQQGLNKQIVIKFAYVVAENTPKGLAAEKFASLVKQKTHGRVKVELFPDGSLYNEFDEINALENGNIQMTAPSFSIISNQIPQWSIMDLPFAFSNQKAIQAALDGDIGKQLLETLNSKNMVGLALWENGFRQLTDDKRALIQPQSVSGLIFRTETSKISEQEFRTLNATAVALPFNQLYKKLEEHTVDGEENSISNIYTQKLYQVQKYMTISRISYLGYAVLMNEHFWNSLPANLQQEIRQAMKETTDWERKESILLNNEQLQDLQDHTSMKIHTLTPSEKLKWMEKLKPVYKQFSDVLGSRLMSDVYRIQRQYGP